MNLLDKIKSAKFLTSFGFELPTKAMRMVLLRTEEYTAINEALSQGELTDTSIREFVNELLREFRIGERFQYNVTLALLAVCLERRKTAFAEEYLRDLAVLSLSELSLSTRLAKECLKERKRLAENNFSDYVASDTPVDSVFEESKFISRLSAENINENILYTPEAA